MEQIWQQSEEINSESAVKEGTVLWRLQIHLHAKTTQRTAVNNLAIQVKRKPSWRRKEISSRWRWAALTKMMCFFFLCCKVCKIRETQADYQEVCKKRQERKPFGVRIKNSLQKLAEDHGKLHKTAVMMGRRTSPT